MRLIGGDFTPLIKLDLVSLEPLSRMGHFSRLLAFLVGLCQPHVVSELLVNRPPAMPPGTGARPLLHDGLFLHVHNSRPLFDMLATHSLLQRPRRVLRHAPDDPPGAGRP